MRALRAKVEAAALAFVRASNPQDEVFVLNFADTPRLDVPFTHDLVVLEAGIARIDSIGGTALRDAIATAQTYLRTGVHDRKALVVVSDGRDNSSTTTIQQVERQADVDGVVIHAAGLLNRHEAARQTDDDLDRLTERTGGVAYYPASVDEIEAVMLDLARQIRRRYVLAYSPDDQRRDGRRRTIKVTVAGPEPFVVRTRQGRVLPSGRR